MRRPTPVAIFTYNRPDHTHRALEALARCRRAEDCVFFLYSDGPKSEAAREQVEATRAVLRQWASKLGAELVERPANMGLARSIHAGVTDLCARFGRVVVVEDDLVVSPDFLHFMIESLDRYGADARVLQVGGCTLSPPSSLPTDAFLLPVTSTWGWATWERAWKHFAWEPLELATAKADRDWLRLFDLNGHGAYSAMLRDRLEGRNDSWGILWWYAVSRLRGLVVYPAKSLVWNGGFDGSGVHCGDGEFVGQAAAFGGPSLPDHLSFPDEVAYEAAHLTQLERLLSPPQPAASRPSVLEPLSRIRARLGRLKARVANALG